jgi:hypothetical protein
MEQRDIGRILRVNGRRRTAGFHRVNGVEPKFDDLYIFHLRYFDRDVGLRRLAKTRMQPWSHPDTGLVGASYR